MKRSVLHSYKVIFIPFESGKPSGKSKTFLDGFIAETNPPKVYGRPVDVLVTKKGKLLITDDAANTIWCVRLSN